MENVTQINENIFRLTIPYKDIFTTVYAVKTESGALLFDCASYDEDIENYIAPFLNAIGITPELLKYVFISHNHTDHAGGLSAFLKQYPCTCIVSRAPALAEKFSAYNVWMPEDFDEVLGTLKIVAIPGHTLDSAAIYDERTKIMITGDCLQLYGIYGSGKWGSNISHIHEHIAAIDKLKTMEISRILTAHVYHPCGFSYEGEVIEKALEACITPLYIVKDLICQNPDMDDEQICALYNSLENPTLGSHVVTAVRNALC